MSKTPWVERKSMLEITADRGRAGLDPIDMGYLYIFKNGETRHFSDDSEPEKIVHSGAVRKLFKAQKCN